MIPRLAPGARLRREPAGALLVGPDRGLALDERALAVLERCDGSRTTGVIATQLAALYDGDARAIERDVRELVERLVKLRLVDVDVPPRSRPHPPAPSPRPWRGGEEQPSARGTPLHDRGEGPGVRPYTLVAELTHRCPLACSYCSNPVELAGRGDELDTGAWTRALGEAAALGVVQAHFTGGEPLVRPDLEALVAAARGHGLYASLITSGVPLARERLRALVDAGLEHVQLSVQDATAEGSRAIAGLDAFERKLEVAGWITDAGLPLTLNVVLHRANVDHVPELVALAERVGARRLELANAQYHGFALANRARLLPSREQLERARAHAAAARGRLAGRLEIVFVLPDHFAARPRACMDGWARRTIVIAPTGRVLPCHAAEGLPGLEFASIASSTLEHAWRDAPGMNRFRGDAWMREPCRACPERELDHGGCRCQAFAITGDAAEADPACELSPHRARLEAALAAADAGAHAELAPRRYLARGASSA